MQAVLRSPALTRESVCHPLESPQLYSRLPLNGRDEKAADERLRPARMLILRTAADPESNNFDFWTCLHLREIHPKNTRARLSRAPQTLDY